MARRHTLIPAAIAGTLTLWAATVATAVWEFGSERLFMLLRAGAFTAAMVTIAVVAGVFVKKQVCHIEDGLHDAVHQAADELHTVVAENKQILRTDRTAVDVARQLIASELAKRSPHQGKHGQAA